MGGLKISFKIAFRFNCMPTNKRSNSLLLIYYLHSLAPHIVGTDRYLTVNILSAKIFQMVWYFIQSETFWAGVLTNLIDILHIKLSERMADVMYEKVELVYRCNFCDCISRPDNMKTHKNNKSIPLNHSQVMSLNPHPHPHLFKMKCNEWISQKLIN